MLFAHRRSRVAAFAGCILVATTLACTSTSSPSLPNADTSDAFDDGAEVGPASDATDDSDGGTDTCRIEAETCQNCIRSEVYFGSAYACFERDATCYSALIAARQCACEAQMDGFGSAAYEECFARLDVYGNHGIAAREGYETVCATACR
jgi:hypothetical protein